MLLIPRDRASDIAIAAVHCTFLWQVVPFATLESVVLLGGITELSTNIRKITKVMIPGLPI